MNASLFLLAGWLSAALAPLDPKQGKYPESEQVQPPAPASKPPAITRPAKASLRPGSYSLESLKPPEVLKLEAFEAWSQGAAWPELERGVVIVTNHADDPQRFMAFLVDVKGQRIAAVRDGETARHLAIITQGQTAPRPGKDEHGQITPTTQSLAGSGVVIVVTLPRPPGPRGWPDDLTARILDVATMSGSAAEWMAAAPIK